MYHSTIGYLKALIRTFKDPQTKALLLFVIFTLALGTIIFSYIEQWDFIDAFYFSVITLTTTGYGDIAPATTTGKLFTVVYLFTGLGLMFAFLKKVAENAMKGRKLK